MTEVPKPDKREQLRRSLAVPLRKREARWLHAGGFSADRVSEHAALLRGLTAVGLAEDATGRALPSSLVLDWTSTNSCSADGLALFGVLGLHLSALGLRPIVCGPAMSDLALLLEATGLRGASWWERWIETDTVPASRLRPLGRAGIFGGDLGRGSLDGFIAGLTEALHGIQIDAARADIIEAIAMDMIQNARAHTAGASGCVIAVVEHRRRPARVQIGTADSGLGIPAHLLRQTAYDDLVPFTDFTVVQAVLSHALTGRSGGDGGGFSRLAARIVENFGGEVCVRSGAGLLYLRPGAPARGARLSVGWGTQVLVTIPVRG